MRRSPCLDCERRDEDKNKCVKTCKDLHEYREWEKTSPWMPPPTYQPGNGTIRQESEMADGTILTGAEIRAIRRRLGWTQAELADALGISRQRIGQIEQENPPAPITLQKIIKRRCREECGAEKREPAAQGGGSSPEMNTICPWPGCEKPASTSGNHLCEVCRSRAAEAGYLRRLAKQLRRRDPGYAASLEIEAVLVRFNSGEWETILAKAMERLRA